MTRGNATCADHFQGVPFKITKKQFCFNTTAVYRLRGWTSFSLLYAHDAHLDTFVLLSVLAPFIFVISSGLHEICILLPSVVPAFHIALIVL